MDAAKLLGWIVVLTAGVLVGPAEAEAAVLLGCGADGILYDIDPVTGAASNPRDTSIEHLGGIAFSADGMFYGFSASRIPELDSGVIYLIDPVTGASGGGHYFQVAYGEGDLAFDPRGDLVYVVTSYSTFPDGTPAGAGNDSLFQFDFLTRVQRTVGHISGHLDASGLAFDDSGTLYALDTYGERLITLDTSNADILSSVPLSVPLGAVAGMTFNPATGLMYVADGYDDGTKMLYTLDPDTGVLTAIGPTGLDDGLAGLAFIPEPGTLVLLVAGSLTLVRRTSRGNRGR